MAIDTITPVASSVINPGDSISFKVDDTYTTLTIEITTDAGVEYAYDTGAGGQQTGYIVSVEDTGGGEHIFTFTRDAGWDKEPQQITVTEDESGSLLESTWSYFLGSQQLFPQGDSPYSPVYEGTLRASADNVTISSTVGWMEFPTADFTVTDLGGGKIQLEVVGAGGGTWGSITGTLSDQTDLQTELDLKAETLDDAINATTPDNDVDVPVADPIILRNNGAAVIPLTVQRTGTGGHGLTVLMPNSIVQGIEVQGLDDYDTVVSGNGILFGDRNVSGLSFYGVKCEQTALRPASVTIEGQDTTHATNDGGLLILNGGEADGGSGADGGIIFGANHTSDVSSEVPIFINEQPSANADKAAYGQIWVKDDAPNTLWFTDDAGTDAQLGTGGTLDTVITAGTPDNDVTIPTGDSIIFRDAADGDAPVNINCAGANSIPLRVFGASTSKQLATFNDGTEELWVFGSGVVISSAADHPHTPAAWGSAFWVKNDTPNTPVFTNEAGTDYSITHGPTVAVDDAIPTFDGVNGRVQVGTGLAYSAGELSIASAVGSVKIQERASGPTPGAGNGSFWVRNDAPSVPVFTDDIGVDHVLNAAGSGDVVGPASATDDAIVVFDGTTGKVVKNSTGTIAQITANTAKVTNQLHTGDVAGATSLTIQPAVVDVAMLSNGTDGELITWDAAGAAATVPVGTATHVLTSNGAGAAPTFQAPAAGGGDVSGPGVAVEDSSVVVWDGTTGTDVQEANVKFGTTSAGVGTRTISASAVMAGGFITGTGEISAVGGGCMAIGLANEVSGTAAIIGDATCSGIVVGNVFSLTGSALVTGSSAGTLTVGQAQIFAAGTAEIKTDGAGSAAIGNVNGPGSTVETTSTATGGFAQGTAVAGGVIRCDTSAGNMSRGYATGTGSTVISTGLGALSSGATSASGDILSSGDGALAGGLADTNATTASGDGSFAWGDNTSGAITASAANSGQFGVGVNALANSFSVGSPSGDGVRLCSGGAPGTPQDGDIWVDGSGNVIIRSGGSNVTI